MRGSSQGGGGDPRDSKLILAVSICIVLEAVLLGLTVKLVQWLTH